MGQAFQSCVSIVSWLMSQEGMRGFSGQAQNSTWYLEGLQGQFKGLMDLVSGKSLSPAIRNTWAQVPPVSSVTSRTLMTSSEAQFAHL